MGHDGTLQLSSSREEGDSWDALRPRTDGQGYPPPYPATALGTHPGTSASRYTLSR